MTDNAQALEDQPQGFSVPWEERKSLGYFNSFFLTWQEVLFHPQRFYQRMTPEGGFLDPLIFGVLWGIVGAAGAFFWQSIFQTITSQIIPLPEEGFGGLVPEGIFSFLFFLFSPLIALIYLLVFSGIYHLFIMMVGGYRYGFETTLRVLCYSSATQVWNFLPLCGAIIAPIWQLILYIIGFKEAHGMSTGRAVLAVFLPVIAVVLIVFIVVFGLVLFGVYTGGFNE